MTDAVNSTEKRMRCRKEFMDSRLPRGARFIISWSAAARRCGGAAVVAGEHDEVQTERMEFVDGFGGSPVIMDSSTLEWPSTPTPPPEEDGKPDEIQCERHTKFSFVAI